MVEVVLLTVILPTAMQRRAYKYKHFLIALSLGHLAFDQHSANSTRLPIGLKISVQTAKYGTRIFSVIQQLVTRLLSEIDVMHCKSPT